MPLLKPIEIKTLHLRPGLHLLTYIDAIDKFHPPLVNITVPMGLIESRVTMMFLEANNEGFLNRPEDAVVIRVIGEPAELSIGIFITTDCKSPEIKLKTQYLLAKDESVLSSAIDKKTALSAKENQDLSTEEIFQLSFSGHVEWEGDKQLAAGEALGNPDKGWRIERFAIHWPKKPEEVDIEYRCHVKTIGDTLKTSLNGFVGTKARALPITGLSVQLTGLKAKNYELIIEVIFSETGLRTLTADGQFIWGIHDNEFLTGIRGFVRHKAIDSYPAQTSAVENKWSNTDSSIAQSSVAEDNFIESGFVEEPESWANPVKTSPVKKSNKANVISF